MRELSRAALETRPVGSEFPLIKMGATVGTYLAVLTESNARGMLRRKVRVPPNVARA